MPPKAPPSPGRPHAAVAFARRRAPAALLLPLALACAPATAAADPELTNAGDAPVSVLRTGTALDRVLAEDAFEIVRTVKGWPPVERPVYTGRRYKRAPPGPDDFVRLAPGETLAGTVALEAHYDVPAAGDYRVRFDGAFRVAPEGPFDDAAGPGTGADVPTELVDVVPGDGGALEMTLHPSAGGARARPPAFAGCDGEQRDGLVEATLAAEGLVTDAIDALRTLPAVERPASPRYGRWFGAYAPERYALVIERFERVLGALAGETLGFDCRCNEPRTFAYVYPNAPYDVFLCPLFFDAATLGTDSRAGTIVHELSHFWTLGGTDDHRYGQVAVAALAASDPALAVDNADGVEYFAENTPFLPMADDGTGNAPPAPAGGGGGAPATPVTFAALEPGVAVRGALAGGELALFEADGAATVTLTSLSGDVDLYVVDDLAADAPVCASAAPSGTSTVETCELPGPGPWYAIVAGFEDSDYEIVASGPDAIEPEAAGSGTAVPGTGAASPGGTPAGAVPPGDAPAGAETPSRSVEGTPSGTPDAGTEDGGGGGGGALGGIGAALAACASALRRRRLRRAGRRSAAPPPAPTSDVPPPSRRPAPCRCTSSRARARRRPAPSRSGAWSGSSTPSTRAGGRARSRRR